MGAVTSTWSDAATSFRGGDVLALVLLGLGTLVHPIALRPLDRRR